MFSSFRQTTEQWWGLFLLATSLLTRLPVSLPKASRTGKGSASSKGANQGGANQGGAIGQACMAFPLVGLALGLMAAVVYSLTVSSFGNLGASLLAVATMVFASGAIHEDGLKDSADGIWGGSNKQARLKIMKDPTSGSYGVVALILVLSARVFFLAYLATGEAVFAIIIAAVLSRSAMAIPPFFLMPVGGKLGESFRPKSEHFASCLSVAVLIALLFGGVISGLGATMAAFAVAGVITCVAKLKLGGFNGDICGATQQVTEVAVLAALIFATAS